MQRNGVKEIAPCEFVIENEDTEDVFPYLVTTLTNQDYEFINLLDLWILEYDGETEDCIQETKAWYCRRGIPCSV